MAGLNITFKAKPDPLDLVRQLNGVNVATFERSLMPQVIEIARHSGVQGLRAAKPALISQGLVDVTGSPPHVLMQFRGSFVAHIQDIGAKAHTIQPAALRRLAVTAGRMNKTGRNLSRKETKALLKHGDNQGKEPMMQLRGGGYRAEAAKGGNKDAPFARKVRHPGVSAQHFTVGVAKEIAADVQAYLGAMKDVPLTGAGKAA